MKLRRQAQDDEARRHRLLLALIEKWRAHQPKRNATTRELTIQFGRDQQFQECADELESVLLG